MPPILRNRRLRLSLLASLLVHLLALWAYQRWAAERVQDLLRPVRFELAPRVQTQRFEPQPATVPETVLEQLRLARELEEAPLPEVDVLPLPTLDAPRLQPLVDGADAFRPALQAGDTVSYDSVITDLYQRKMLDLIGRRMRVLPLADTTSEAGRRRNRAEAIVARAIEAMGGLERLRAVRDKVVARERKNPLTGQWNPLDTLSYLRGTRYRQDISHAIARGYDGHRSWYVRYGLLLPPQDESHAAERWDFLSRFRGDGVLVEYVGPRTTRHERWETIRVIDTKFGRQRLAYFSVRDSLLKAELAGGTTTTYQSYRQVEGALTPFEVWAQVRERVAVSRWHTQLNVGLRPDRFAVPEAISWEPEMVHKVIFQHAAPPVLGPSALRVALGELTQGVRPDGRPYLGSLSMHLLDAYMKEKLRSAGVLARREEADWRLEWRVVEFWIRGAMATIDIAVAVQSLAPGGALWEGKLHDRWPVSGTAAIDESVGDRLTYGVLSLASAGMKLLGDAAAQPVDAGADPIPQLADSPSAGSSSDSP